MTNEVMEKNKTLAFSAFLLSALPWGIWLYIQVNSSRLIEWLWLFPIPAPIATILAFLAYNRKIKQPERYGGESYYVAAMVLGIIGTAFLILIILNGGTETT